jgi:uncharacterized peroxidase-related enzyme
MLRRGWPAAPWEDAAVNPAAAVDRDGPFIAVPPEIPGIRGLMATKPQSGAKLLQLAQQLLRGPSPLTPGERELIAAVVSAGNDCAFCTNSHAAVARQLAGGAADVVDAAIDDIGSAPVSDKVRALLVIADKVRRSGLDVAPADIAAARAVGAVDEDIHDTVLIAAAFCMFNRYVDGLRALTPTHRDAYVAMGARLAEQGYAPVT